jgi:hypothetical protein
MITLLAGTLGGCGAMKSETASAPGAAASGEQVKEIMPGMLEGISPLEEAPAVSAEHWAELQKHAHSQVTLAGYRIADVIVSAADRLLVEHTMTGNVLERMDNVQTRTAP